MKAWFLILLSVSVLGCASLHGDHWPQFRGPQASGRAEGSAAPTSWDVETGTNIQWRRRIPGLAHASPIIWGDHVYVLTAVGAKESDLKVGLYGDIDSADPDGEQSWRLIALQKSTGFVLWNRLARRGQPRVKRHPKATHCNSTPATDGRNIVALLGSEGLFCFSRDGRLRWQRDLGPMDSGYFRVQSAQWGFASSPIIHEGKVIVQCDVQEGSFIAAFAIEDGHELWRRHRQEVPTWSSPSVTTRGERAQVVVNG